MAAPFPTSLDEAREVGSLLTVADVVVLIPILLPRHQRAVGPTSEPRFQLGQLVVGVSSSTGYWSRCAATGEFGYGKIHQGNGSKWIA
jgi:hypothetical protein